MLKNLKELRQALQNEQADIAAVRQAALEMLDHVEEIQGKISFLSKWYESENIHTHHFAATDTNGNQILEQYAIAVALPSKGYPTGIALGQNIQVGKPISLSRPRPDM